MRQRHGESEISGIVSLAEPQRLKLYRLVANAEGSVSRDEAAQALGIAKSVAAFHLDRLEADGLLEAEFRRPEGRGGPGAGRPTKRYRRSGREFAVSVPERQYAFAASLMAQAITRTREENIPVDQALNEAAAAAGSALGAQALTLLAGGETDGSSQAAVRAVLDEFGYETTAAAGQITLRNCPFRQLADQDTELVCGMNLRFIEGLLDAVGDPRLRARLEPSEECCCVPISTG